jgi:hypothetical protein
MITFYYRIIDYRTAIERSLKDRQRSDFLYLNSQLTIEVR